MLNENSQIGKKYVDKKQTKSESGFMTKIPA